MPWIIGIDEAGYGPNLGPFVMTAVACRVPEVHAKADLWKLLERAARRHSDPCDGRIVIADSKLVYSTARGLSDLEHTVQACFPGPRSSTLAALVDRVCGDCHEAIRGEVWYDGSTVLPVAADGEACERANKSLDSHAKDLEISWGIVNSVVVCPRAFNAVIGETGSKGGVLATSLVKLLRDLPADGEAVYVACDKHGGRNFYGGYLQTAFEDEMVLSRQESDLCSHYYVESRGRRVELTFEPRADTNHFCVALASMVSKYLRELFMLEFNRFWQARVPGLKATAGYPSDAKRFWGDIQEAVTTLALAKNTLWRMR